MEFQQSHEGHFDLQRVQEMICHAEATFVLGLYIASSLNQYTNRSVGLIGSRTRQEWKRISLKLRENLERVSQGFTPRPPRKGGTH